LPGADGLRLVFHLPLNQLQQSLLYSTTMPSCRRWPCNCKYPTCFYKSMGRRHESLMHKGTSHTLA
jgi:hypothetical protein